MCIKVKTWEFDDIANNFNQTKMMEQVEGTTCADLAAQKS